MREGKKTKEGGWGGLVAWRFVLDTFKQKNAGAGSGNVPHFPFSTKESVCGQQNQHQNATVVFNHHDSSSNLSCFNLK